MFNSSVFIFILGWVLWFFIDKQPASLGVVVPDEMDTMLENFQLSFDILKAGFLSAAFVFIWKAHYFVLSAITGLLLTILIDSGRNLLRRRRLHKLMWSQHSVSTGSGEAPADILPGDVTSQQDKTR